jgi:hypothetical protein
MTAKLGGVTTGAEIHHFEPAVNSNSLSGTRRKMFD